METGNRPDQYAYDGFADHGGRLCYSDLCGRPVAFHAVCNADGKWLNFLDALFTACSAVCVTGLVTITPAVRSRWPES